MKKFLTGAVVALGAISMMGVSTIGVAAPAARKAPVVEAKADRSMYQVEQFRASLSPAQAGALVQAGMNWRPLAEKPDLLWTQVNHDVTRILTPSQARVFLTLVEPSLNAGGVYKKYKCWLDTKNEFLFSVIGLIGCPVDTATEATWTAFEAAVAADQCIVNATADCPDAVANSQAAAILWGQLEGSCDLADTAMYSCAIAYAACGGTW